MYFLALLLELIIIYFIIRFAIKSLKKAKSKFISNISPQPMQTTQAHILRERSLMTNSLRYDILKRDGFRCTICGRSQDDGVKLHVDHIKPVSKGGRTTPSNLRTLCEDCNQGKKAKYDPFGLN